MQLQNQKKIGALSCPALHVQIDLHGLNVDEAMAMLDRHLANLGGLSAPGGILLQACHVLLDLPLAAHMPASHLSCCLSAKSASHAYGHRTSVC